MKRRNLKVLRIFAACLVLSLSCALFACNKPDEEVKPIKPSNTQITEWSFESLDEIYKCFSMQTAFGRVSLNEDPQYVTVGNRSLKVESLGTYNPSLADPSLRIRLGDLASVKTGDGLSKQGAYDFSKIKSISFDIFNMNKEAQTLSVRFVADGRTTNASVVEVPVGKTENCTIEVNVNAMQLTTDMSKTTELNIFFPAVEEFEGDPYVFYIDNLKINFHTEEVPPYELIRDENELCSFEKEYQQFIVTADAIGPASGCLPTSEINTDPQFSKDGIGKSLKVVFPTGTLPLNDGWPYWTFTTGFLESIDFKQYGDQDAYIAFDVYVPEGSRSANFQTHFVYKTVYDEDGQKINIAAEKYYFRPTVGAWTEVVIPASAWSRFYDAENNPIDTNITAIRLVTDKFSGDPKTFYFDNFRFVIPDNRDMVGGEDFINKTTDVITIQGSEVKAQTDSARYVSGSNAEPHFFGKYNGLRAGTEWVLAVHNNRYTNDIYYEYDTSAFEFAKEGDTVTIDAWAYTWRESDWNNIADKLFKNGWTLEFYKYRADGNYASASPIYEYALGKCGSPKWKRGIEIPADVVAAMKESGKLVFRVNINATLGCYEYELFLDNLTIVKAPKTIQSGQNLQNDLNSRFEGMTVSIQSIKLDGIDVTLTGWVFAQPGRYVVEVKVESQEYRENTFTLVYNVT